MVAVYIALGSNLGDRESYLRAGILGLCRRGIGVTRCASIYLTEPRDVAAQPWFLNTVIEASTVLGPDELLDVCLAVEQENGRAREVCKGPRTLDIDIIFYANATVQTPRLIIPHPRYAGRRFVLEPLAELAAGFVDPLRQKPVRELLQQTTDMAVVHRTAPPLL